MTGTQDIQTRITEIARLFRKLDLAEERGSGLRSLKLRAQQQGLPLPMYRWNAPYLELSLFRKEDSAVTTTAHSVLMELSVPERKGLALVTKQGAITVAAYAEHMGLDPRQARRHLQHFEQLGLVRATGKTRTRRYELVK